LLGDESSNTWSAFTCLFGHAHRGLVNLLSNEPSLRTFGWQTGLKMHLSPGTRFGPYEVVELVGAGGMGEVYRARDTRLKRDLAVKILPELFCADQSRLARFELEAQSASALNHPNILTVYDIGALACLPHAKFVRRHRIGVAAGGQL
jgi:serine/threonine protein kinase